jgi:hypothetical protein
MNLIDRDFLLSPKRKRLSQGQSQSGFSKNQANQIQLDKVFLPPFDCENELYNSDYRMLDEDGNIRIYIQIYLCIYIYVYINIYTYIYTNM